MAEHLQVDFLPLSHSVSNFPTKPLLQLRVPQLRLHVHSAQQLSPLRVCRNSIRQTDMSRAVPVTPPQNGLLLILLPTSCAHLHKMSWVTALTSIVLPYLHPML